MKRTPILALALFAGLLATGSPARGQETPFVGPVTVDADNTLSADRPILECPIPQEAVQNGARPDSELLALLIRCSWGEKPASKGYDGAVTVDVTALQIGAPRKWKYLEDLGDGSANTTVYPVKATFTEKTFYRYRTAVNSDHIRIFNFHVDAFGEWKGGSASTVKSGVLTDIPR